MKHTTFNICYTFWYCYICKTTAKLKGINIDTIHTIRYYHINQTTAILKGVKSDACDTIWNCYTCKVFATTECIISYFIDILANINFFSVWYVWNLICWRYSWLYHSCILHSPRTIRSCYLPHYFSFPVWQSTCFSIFNSGDAIWICDYIPSSWTVVVASCDCFISSKNCWAYECSSRRNAL